MKKLITKVGTEIIDCRVPNKLYFNEDEGVSKIDKYLILEVTEDTFNFLNQIANVTVNHFGDKTYTVNNIEFKVVDYD